jgi:hypothetical protein
LVIDENVVVDYQMETLRQTKQFKANLYVEFKRVIGGQFF